MTIDVNDLDPRDGEPFGQWILCRKLDRLSLSEGGIVLPESADLETTFAEVVKVGPGPVSAETGQFLPRAMGDVKAGDVLVMGSRYHGVGAKDRREYIWAKPADVVHVYRLSEK